MDSREGGCWGHRPAAPRLRCGVEGLIGRDQRHRAQPGLLALLPDFERGGQLRGVIGTQRVRIRQSHDIVEQDGRDLE